LPGVNYIPLPKIGEGLGEWSEAPSYEEGVGVDGEAEGLPSEKEGDVGDLQGFTLQKGVWGDPPTGQSPEKNS